MLIAFRAFPAVCRQVDTNAPTVSPTPLSSRPTATPTTSQPTAGPSIGPTTWYQRPGFATDFDTLQTQVNGLATGEVSNRNLFTALLGRVAALETQNEVQVIDCRDCRDCISCIGRAASHWPDQLHRLHIASIVTSTASVIRVDRLHRGGSTFAAHWVD